MLKTLKRKKNDRTKKAKNKKGGVKKSLSWQTGLTDNRGNSLQPAKTRRIIKPQELNKDRNFNSFVSSLRAKNIAYLHEQMVNKDMSEKSMLLYIYLLELMKKNNKKIFNNLTDKNLEKLYNHYKSWIKRRNLPPSFQEDYEPDFEEVIIDSQKEFNNRIKKLNVKKLQDFIT